MPSWPGKPGRSVVPLRTDPAVFARARPLHVTLEERYEYQQTIARHATVESVGAPSGQVQVTVPYDGHEHFSRDALADVRGQLSGQDGAQVDAVIGHLVLIDHEDTDLAEVLAIGGRFGAHPLEVPVRLPGLHDEALLCADRYVHETRTSYHPRPGLPELAALRLTVELSDPDNIESASSPELWRAMLRDESTRDTVADSVKGVIGFQPYLQLGITARITLPALDVETPPEQSVPIVRRVSVRLPSALSLSPSSLQLEVRNLTHPMQYDNGISDLQWFDVSTTVEVPRQVHAPRRYTSPPMVLRFQQPGELFSAPTIEITAEVEVPDVLLSGTQARLFDARGFGSFGENDPLAVRSVISTKCVVSLDHSFAERIVSPFQSFHFDEVVPDRLRIADVHAVLADLRFGIPLSEQLNDSTAKRRLRHIIVADREDGPDLLTLHILVEGRRQTTQRDARTAGGHRHRSKFKSGDMTMFVRGQVRGDARVAVHEINALQLALRERFDRLRAPR